MKLRAPSVPLITIDPYFSIWSGSDKLTDTDTVHWTGKPQKLTGTVFVDGKAFRFLGRGDAPALEQTGLEITACTSEYTFENEQVRLTAAFTSPLLPDDLDIASRPVSFLEQRLSERKVSVSDRDRAAGSARADRCKRALLCAKGAEPQRRRSAH